eukprot:362824-Chlamydomonas_euryale.AAC.3
MSTVAMPYDGGDPEGRNSRNSVAGSQPPRALGRDAESCGSNDARRENTDSYAPPLSGYACHGGDGWHGESKGDGTDGAARGAPAGAQHAQYLYDSGPADVVDCDQTPERAPGEATATEGEQGAFLTSVGMDQGGGAGTDVSGMPAGLATGKVVKQHGASAPTSASHNLGSAGGHTGVLSQRQVSSIQTGRQQ